MRIGSHRLRVRRLCEQYRRRMRNEGLWDMFINHGAQIAFAKSFCANGTKVIFLKSKSGL